MKLLRYFFIISSISIFATNNSFAQNIDPIKSKFFLKNYQAPDFKQHRLLLDLKMSGNGYEGMNSFNENSKINYFFYSNSRKYQGNFRLGLNSNFTRTKNEFGPRYTGLFNLSNTTTNRFYIKENLFIGVHNRIGANLKLADSFNEANNGAIGIVVSPVVSIGLGRLESIKYARNAMDIENALTKSGRLNEPFTTQELNEIANEIAILKNQRVYDSRLQRIAQLEMLDKKLSEMGRISDFDMTYFANLSDAYLYAGIFKRYSGTRHEFGFIENVLYLHDNISEDNNYNSSKIFYNFTFYNPISYTLQQNFNVTILAGSSTFNNDPLVENNNFGIANVSYAFEIYPTTRTNFGFRTNLGLSVRNQIGASANIGMYGNYYISPKMRFSYNIGVNYNDGYYVTFNNNYILPNVTHSINTNGFSIDGNAKFSYAIF